MASFIEKVGFKILSPSRMPGMKCVITALVVMTLSAASAAAETPVAKVSQLQLYTSFWQNLHHFPYVSAWATRPFVPGQPRLAMPLPPGSDVLDGARPKRPLVTTLSPYMNATSLQRSALRSTHDDDQAGACRSRRQTHRRALRPRAEDAAPVGGADLPEVRWPGVSTQPIVP